MLHRNIFNLVLILFASLQITVHGRMLPMFFWKEIQRKFGEFRNNQNAHAKPGPIFEACNMCVWGYCTPAIKPRPVSEFHEGEDARRLQDAFGFRVDRDTITNILTARSETQRKLISENMKENGGLAQFIASGSDSSRHMSLMQALALPLIEFYVIQFQIAIEIQNDRTKSKEGRIVMIEMFTTLSPCLIGKIIRAYNLRKKGESFVTDIETSLKGFPPSDYIDVFKTLAQGQRDEGVKTSWLKAYIDAKRMRDAIETQHLTNIKEVFREVFTKRSIPQLKETIIVYENLRQGAEGFTSLHDDINTHMESVKEIYATIVKTVQNQPMYFASLFHMIFETYTESKAKFITLIRARCDIDLGDIKEAYEETYKKSLLSSFQEVEKTDGPFPLAVSKIIE